MVGSRAATTRRRMNTANVTSASPWASTMRDVLVKYLSVWLPIGPASSDIDELVEDLFIARNQGSSLVHHGLIVTRKAADVKRPLPPS